MKRLILWLFGKKRKKYATWNPLDIGTGLTLSADKLTVTCTGSSWRSVRSTISKTVGPGKGVYQVEFEVGGTSDALNRVVGIENGTRPVSSHFLTVTPGASVLYTNNGTVYKWDASSFPGNRISLNAVLGLVINLDVGAVAYYVNGVPSGATYIDTTISGTVFLALSLCIPGQWVRLNAGQQAMRYPISGATPGWPV